ncbi:hypothetical protein DL95DRAFT_435057 [Leptodontidium sp. 2 PMI_412]|nr:hypothetical protein DL95DRAFT_435057 [Leptodontidium sp. 2 PMI_412]
MLNQEWLPISYILSPMTSRGSAANSYDWQIFCAMGAEEVTFKDLTDGTSKGKAGYGKIQFCGEQARRDNLQYFWVDTCYIDKSNAVELQEAINLMFRWYRDATKCYLITPALVDFFCKQGGLLGDKTSLEQDICEITRIPANALRGSPLSDFNVAERLSWAISRIFGIHLPLIYSEGKENAFKRLKKKI